LSLDIQICHAFRVNLIDNACCVINIVVIFWGDPHFQTMDKLQYTFNGLGEYWLVKSEKFNLQARTLRAWNNDGEFSDWGTVFAAVAGEAKYQESTTTVTSDRVHVEMPPDRELGMTSSVLRYSYYKTRRHCSVFINIGY